MRVVKIINDPVYGFISIPEGVIYQIIEHPVFQRLRRIKQGGFSHLVYPGAMHTRFHHALGAFHLGTEAVETLRQKGVEITREEAEGLWIALLLHDLGHGPFSHTLEHFLLRRSHEEVTLALMKRLNLIFNGKLDLAIQIFQNNYNKPFLNQLVSGQLDLDRVDYLARDSFFTGVAEGVIGYRRIIKMLNVVDGQLVVEEKGIYSVEKFLMARKFMYWQVYFHKAVISAEQMLQAFIRRLRNAVINKFDVEVTDSLHYFLSQWQSELEDDELLDNYIKLDDADIVMALKRCLDQDDVILRLLSTGLLNRKLYKVRIQDSPLSRGALDQLAKHIEDETGLPESYRDTLIFHGTIRNIAYSEKKREINILKKDGSIAPLSEIAQEEFRSGQSTKYYYGHIRLNQDFSAK